MKSIQFFLLLKNLKTREEVIYFLRLYRNSESDSDTGRKAEAVLKTHFEELESNHKYNIF